MSQVIDFSNLLPADVDRILPLEAAAHAMPWTRGNFLDSLNSGHVATLMQSGGSVLGYAVVMPLPGEAELLNITIAPASQRQGWGRQLLQHVCAAAQAGGAERLFLEVRASNLPARTLYAKSGFAEVGLRRGYYACPTGEREDAVLMAKTL